MLLWSLLFLAFLSLLWFVCAQSVIQLLQGAFLNPLRQLNLKHMVRLRQYLLTNKIYSIVCDIVVFQVVLGELLVRLHAELELLQYFRLIIELAIASTDLFKRFCAGETLKQFAETYIFNWVATDVELLKHTRLINANLKQALCSVLIDAAIGQRHRL